MTDLTGKGLGPQGHVSGLRPGNPGDEGVKLTNSMALKSGRDDCTTQSHTLWLLTKPEFHVLLQAPPRSLKTHRILDHTRDRLEYGGRSKMRCGCGINAGLA